MTSKQSGGKTRSDIASLFEYVGNHDKCKVLSCGYQSKEHTSNQRRHLKDRHREIYDQIYPFNQHESEFSTTETEEESTKESTYLNRVALNKTTLKTALLKLVTINGRPFSILQDEGMRMILDPLISRMPEKVIINEETVKDDVINTANNIKKTIQKEVKECNLVSLKVDIASRLGRSFLGVNIQYIRGGKIIIRTLAVEEITERHSGENLKNLILRTFDLYGIDVKNIYSFTSDNGTNMVKLSELLAEEQNLPVEEDDARNELMCNIDNTTLNNTGSNTDNPIEEDMDFEINDSTTMDDDNDLGFDLELQPDLSEMELSGSMETLQQSFSLVNIRCAAHTLQLAVQAAINKSNLQKSLSKARNAAKIFRVDSTINEIRRLRSTASKPVLDLPTRWSSTYDMLFSLLKLEDFKSYVPPLRFSNRSGNIL
ncbi:Protein of unknown function [Cotesia congregata]|uniref:Uncharacterized protein n=1 Tax=Cotesia congregata TaxID=51543 RepID=A0A8J2HJ66_COTCN|nr:Protein of unknown function [Cotesia congregata]